MRRASIPSKHSSASRSKSNKALCLVDAPPGRQHINHPDGKVERETSRWLRALPVEHDGEVGALERLAPWEGIDGENC